LGVKSTRWSTAVLIGTGKRRSGVDQNRSNCPAVQQYKTPRQLEEGKLSRSLSLRRMAREEFMPLKGDMKEVLTSAV